MIDGFNDLPFENDAFIKEMIQEEKEQIAEEMPVSGWQHFVDHYTEDEDDRKQIKSSISNSWESKRTPTDDLISLIIQIYPDYTMKDFFNACSQCKFHVFTKMNKYYLFI